MKIERIEFSGTLPDSFFALPSGIYKQLPYQPEEDPAGSLQLLREKAGSHELILYTDHEHIRLLGIFPQEETAAYFGYWETTNNPDINRQAFALLQADAQARGRSAISGPYHFNTFQRYRLRLHEPVWQVFDREPVNPPYYPVLLQQLGYEAELTFESRLIRTADIPAVYEDKEKYLSTLQELPFSFIPLTPDSWEQLKDEIFELVNAIFSQNPGYRKISKQEFGRLYNQQYAEKLCPYSSVLFRDKSRGRLAAMSFCHPNYHFLDKVPLKPNFKRDFPLLKKKMLLAKSVGVHPAYRQQGVMSYLAAYAMQSFRDLYEEVLFCLMRSDNHSLQFSEGLPYESAHYALYRKEI